MSRLGKQCSSLLRKIKYNDNANYEEQLMNLTWNHLASIAMLYLRDKNDAPDVVQNTFLRAFQYINSFQDNQDGFNWLCKIAQREAYTFNKKFPPTISFEEAYLIPQQKDFTEDVVNLTVISQYLQSYEQRDQEIIYLHFFKDLSYKEIADKLGMRKSNVHRRCTTIIKEILMKFKKELDD